MRLWKHVYSRSRDDLPTWRPSYSVDNEIRDLQDELLEMVCYDVQVEPALQPITGKELARGTNQAPDARLDVHCRGFWERQRAAFFDIRVCHPNADSYRDLSPKQIYRIHENIA